MQKKTSMLKYLLQKCVPALLISIGLVILFGYLFGYKAILVNGWSAEPHIRYQSLIITRKCKMEDLKVGDFITFTKSGKSYVTHQIVSIDYENDEIVCKGWQYNKTTQEYEYQSDSQYLKYENVVGKVVISNYPIGKTIFILKGNVFILVGLLGGVMLLLILKEQLKVEPEF